MNEFEGIRPALGHEVGEIAAQAAHRDKRIGELLMPVRAGLPVHVVQGMRDPFGGPDHVRRALASEGVEIDGDRVRVDEAPGAHFFTDGAPAAALVTAHLTRGG